MTTSRERRKLRRAGSGVAEVAMSSGETRVLGKRTAPGSKWKSLWNWLAYSLPPLAVLGIFILYPWLVVREEGFGAGGPPTPSFTVVNRGYIPVTALSAACTFTASDPHTIAMFEDRNVLVQHFINSLPYGRGISVPCIGKMLRDPNGFFMKPGSEASMEIAIRYRLIGILVHIPQRFQFRVEQDTNGQLRLRALKR